MVKYYVRLNLLLQNRKHMFESVIYPLLEKFHSYKLHFSLFLDKKFSKMETGHDSFSHSYICLMRPLSKAETPHLHPLYEHKKDHFVEFLFSKEEM